MAIFRIHKNWTEFSTDDNGPDNAKIFEFMDEKIQEMYQIQLDKAQ